MEPEHFKFRGKQVKQAILTRIWEGIRLELASKYPVDNVELPNTIAMVLNYKNFVKAHKKLLSSSHIEDTSEMEYGAKVTTIPSATTTFADVDQTWIILKCGGYGYSLEVDLRHELLHLWEAKLGLKWGTLTQMGNRKGSQK